MTDEKIKAKILHLLIYKRRITFHDFWDSEAQSNKFLYYLDLLYNLNQLLEEGYIERDKDKKYYLTTKGKALESSLDAKTGLLRKKPSPFASVLLVVRRNNKYLMRHIIKEPFYGFYGFPVGKVGFGENILSSAKKELCEETGLEGEGKLISVFNSRGQENNNLFIQCTLFLVFFDEPKGELKQKTNKGEYSFVDKTEFLQKNKEGVLFPDNLVAFEKINENNNHLDFYETSFDIVDGKFKNYDCKKIQ